MSTITIDDLAGVLGGTVGRAGGTAVIVENTTDPNAPVRVWTDGTNEGYPFDEDATFDVELVLLYECTYDNRAAWDDGDMPRITTVRPLNPTEAV